MKAMNMEKIKNLNRDQHKTLHKRRRIKTRNPTIYSWRLLEFKIEYLGKSKTQYFSYEFDLRKKENS